MIFLGHFLAAVSSLISSMSAFSSGAGSIGRVTEGAGFPLGRDVLVLVVDF